MRALNSPSLARSQNLRLIELLSLRPIPQQRSSRSPAGAISPSDVKNVEGKMEHTTLPRLPGRDYAGTVIHGPVEWIGVEVWGTRAARSAIRSMVAMRN